MPLAGAGFGASKALEQILAEQMMQAQLAQRERENADRVRMEQARLDAATKQSDANNAFEQQRIDMAAGDRRERNNVRGVRRMLGEAIVQKQGPITSDDRRGMAALQVEAGDDPSLLNEPPQKAPGTHVVSGNLVDDTGKVLFTAPKEHSGSGSPQKQVWIKRGDQVIPIQEGTAQPGDVPYDPVAARSSQPANPAEAQDTAREAARLARALLAHKGLNGAFGVVDSMLPTMRQDTADAESLRDSLTSLLTLENTGKLKGVLSNTDMQILRAASSSLNPKMGDKAARAELERIAQVMDRAAGGQVTPNMAPSHGPAVDPRVADLIKKYGGG